MMYRIQTGIVEQKDLKDSIIVEFFNVVRISITKNFKTISIGLRQVLLELNKTLLTLIEYKV